MGFSKGRSTVSLHCLVIFVIDTPLSSTNSANISSVTLKAKGSSRRMEG